MSVLINWLPASWLKALNYSKFIVAAIGAILTTVSVLYGHQHWYTIAVAVVTAVTVFLARNVPTSAGEPSTGPAAKPDAPADVPPSDVVAAPAPAPSAAPPGPVGV